MELPIATGHVMAQMCREHHAMDFEIMSDSEKGHTHFLLIGVILTFPGCHFTSPNRLLFYDGHFKCSCFNENESERSVI